MNLSEVRRVPAALGTVAAMVVLAACGSSSSSSKAPAASSTPASTPASTSTAATTAPATTTGTTASLPGAGKPAVTIGDKNFTEEYILGELYTQALKAQGYNVTLKGNIGTTELTYKALQSGQIDM